MSRAPFERIREALPQGTISVGIGLVVSGLTAYAFLVLSGRALGPAGYASLSVLWTLVFLVAPGFFLPLEQELGRRIAEGETRQGTESSVVRRSILAAVVLTVGLVGIALAASPTVLDRLLDGQILLFAALVISFVTYAGAYLIRGALSGSGGFARYGLIVGGEGVIRLAACVLFFFLGISSAGPYGLAVAVAPLIAVIALPVRPRTGRRFVGHTGGWSTALINLLAGSVLAQALINAGPIAVKLLATEQEGAQAGRFLAGLVMARIPLFLFQAVQAALLPKLARLAAAGQKDAFKVVLQRILLIVAGVGVASTVGAYVIGPAALEILFGDGFVLGGRDLALMAAGSSLCMAAIALSQALVALKGHARVPWAWLSGVATFILVVGWGSDLLLRVELAFVAGTALSTLVMGGLTMLKLADRSGMRKQVRLLNPWYAETS